MEEKKLKDVAKWNPSSSHTTPAPSSRILDLLIAIQSYPKTLIRPLFLAARSLPGTVPGTPMPKPLVPHRDSTSRMTKTKEKTKIQNLALEEAEAGRRRRRRRRGGGGPTSLLPRRRWRKGLVGSSRKSLTVSGFLRYNFDIKPISYPIKS
jgi:hypothetical protein